jgi:hypothetical protein
MKNIDNFVVICYNWPNAEFLSKKIGMLQFVKDMMGGSERRANDHKIVYIFHLFVTVYNYNWPNVKFLNKNSLC